MTRLVEIFISMANFGILHVKHLMLPHMSTLVEMKVIIEWYHSNSVHTYVATYRAVATKN